MPPKKALKPIQDEASCSEFSADESSSSDDDNSLGSFIVDDDELSGNESSVDMEDEPPAAPEVPAPAKKRGRPKKDPTLKSKPVPSKPPGDSAYPINDFSLTVTKTKDDVGLDALDMIAHWIEHYCVKGGVATEVGQRAFQLHLQGLFRIRWPSNREYTLRLQKLIKDMLPNKGKLYKVLVKVFGINQHFSAMVGYITKDQGNYPYSLFFIVFPAYSHCYYCVLCIRTSALPGANSPHHTPGAVLWPPRPRCSADIIRRGKEDTELEELLQ